ncbi:hypothetical protein OPQ81_010199 [Rhizoctonia solani]|nr:hypothetical protein OPQ81_010199 [Rhizoctonia solani]
MEPSARQRSRKGCLTCRQKRKKCDEIKPVCGRCKGGEDCIWPTSHLASKAASAPSRLPRIQPRPLLDLKPAGKFASPIATAPTSAPRENKSTSNRHPYELNGGCLNMFPEVAIEGVFHGFAPYPSVDFIPPASNTLGFLLGLGTSQLAPTSPTFGIQEPEPPLGLEYGTLLPALKILEFACTNEDGPNVILDEDEEEAFKTAEWLPGALQLTNLCLSLELTNQQRPQWSSIIDSYFTFFVRYSYDPSNLPIYMGDLVAHHFQIESVRLGMLGTSLLFYSFLNPGLPQAPLRKHANELIDAAAAALQDPWILRDLGAYMRCIEKALPIVQKLVGAAPVSIHKLYGLETVDIRLFAWSDVFSAMATSRPTRLVYDCNVDILLRRNQEGPDSPFLDRGLEWLSGLPDAFLLLTIQILNLKHAPISPTDRITQAAKIEAALRGWKVWPSDIANSVMRVQRVSAQEIWRHSTILYLYQAIYKATPSQEVVQDSVKQIVKLASTLRPGHNPDCLLYIPYFLAGTFAASAKDRQFIRDRLMRYGVGTYMKMLAKALDEIWEQSPIHRHVDWTSRNPPLVIF